MDSARSSPARPTNARTTAREPNDPVGHFRETHVHAVIVASRPATLAPAGTTNPVAAGSSSAEPSGYARATTAVFA